MASGTEATSQKEIILTPHELAMPEVLHVEVLGNRTGEEQKGEKREDILPTNTFQHVLNLKLYMQSSDMRNMGVK